MWKKIGHFLKKAVKWIGSVFSHLWDAIKSVLSIIAAIIVIIIVVYLCIISDGAFAAIVEQMGWVEWLALIALLIVAWPTLVKWLLDAIEFLIELFAKIIGMVLRNPTVLWFLLGAGALYYVTHKSQKSSSKSADPGENDEGDDWKYRLDDSAQA